MFKIEDGGKELFQWDLNRKLEILDRTIEEVHFSNLNSKDTIDVSAYDFNGKWVADIPNILLQDSWDINAYGYDDNHTLFEKTLKVNKREKPFGYVYKSTEVHTWEELEKNKLDKKGWEADKLLGTDAEGNVIIKDIGAGQVISVNGKTGEVVIDSNDIAFDDGETFQQKLNNGTLKGDKGDTGAKGADGKIGIDGKSAYEIAVKNGFQGNEVEWIASLKGKDGQNGAIGADGFSPTANVSKLGDIATITITDKSGTTTTTIKDGEKGDIGLTGANGKDATINGVNALTIQQGENILLNQEGNVMTISTDNKNSFDLSDRMAKAVGDGSIVVGVDKETNIVKGKDNICLGTNNKANSNSAITIGQNNVLDASGKYMFALGIGNEPGNYQNNVLIGNNSKFINSSNVLCIGFRCNGVFASDSIYAGRGVKGDNIGGAIFHGEYNIKPPKDVKYLECVGNGTYNTDSTAYTLDWKGNGAYTGKVSSTGADYAEYFEWKDGNPSAEDRVGYIVALDGDKIVKAQAGDDVLGIISGTVGVLGDNYETQWQGKFLTDDFGRVIYDNVEKFIEVDTEKVSLGMFPHPRLNPEFKESKEYINRANRPEWDAVGMMGKLYVRDNGTCQVGKYAAVLNGIATGTSEKTNMRVIERVNDNVIRVVLK